jgi:hypothetical protein
MNEIAANFGAHHCFDRDRSNTRFDCVSRLRARRRIALQPGTVSTPVIFDPKQAFAAQAPARGKNVHAARDHPCRDIEASEIGREVIVQWGDHGCPIKAGLRNGTP